MAPSGDDDNDDDDDDDDNDDGPIRELKMDEVKSLDPVELRKVDMNDFLDSMKKMKKSVSPDSLAPFETWNHKFGEGSG